MAHEVLYSRENTQFPSKGPFIIDDLNRTCTHCTTCALSDRCVVSEKSLELQARYRRKVICCQINCSSLFTSRNQAYSHCTASVVSDIYGDSEESLEWQARYNRESIMFSK